MLGRAKVSWQQYSGVFSLACVFFCAALGVAVVVSPPIGFLAGLLLVVLVVLALRRRLLHFMVFLVFFELILGGAGRYVELSEFLSFRKALFVFTWLLFIVLWIYDRRKPAFPIRSFRASWYACLLAIFTFLFFGLGIGMLRGNQLEFILADAQGFLFLTLSIPLCYFAWRERISVEFFLGVYLAATSLYGLLKGLAYVGVELGFVGGGLVADLIQENTNQLVLIDLSGSQYRMNTVGDAFLMFAFPVLVGVASSAKRLRTKLAASAGIVFVLLGLVASGTRALWLGAFLGLVVLTALAGSRYKVKIAAGVLVSLLFASQIFAGTFSSVTSKITTSFDMLGYGNAFRVHQTGVLLRMAREHPLLGQGFGAIAPEVSLHPERPYTFEMETVAFLMKIGIVGCLAWATLFGWLLYVLLRSSWLQTDPLHAMVAKALCGGVLAILFAGSTNPWLSIAVGMGTCAFIAVVTDLLRREIAPQPEAAKPAPRSALSRIAPLAHAGRTSLAPTNR